MVSIRSKLFLLVVVAFVAAPMSATTPTKKTTKSTTHSHTTASKKTSKKKKKPLSAAEIARMRRMNHAFVASGSLKPMAKQLLEFRSKPAYAGVESYATKHAGTDEGAMANLVIGYAHVLDKDYPAAIPSLKKAAAHPGELGDYVAYFLAMAYGSGGDEQHVIEQLRGFETKYPESIFTRDAAVVYANALLAAGSPRKRLERSRNMRTPIGLTCNWHSGAPTFAPIRMTKAHRFCVSSMFSSHWQQRPIRRERNCWGSMR